MTVATVRQWTGREARLLREAMRMSLRDFAAYLGMSERAISKWEQAGKDLSPRPDTQAVLDTALEQAPDDVKDRFFEALGDSPRRSTTSAGLRIDSHKFIPVFIGAEAAQQMRAAPPPTLPSRSLTTSKKPSSTPGSTTPTRSPSAYATSPSATPAGPASPTKLSPLNAASPSTNSSPAS